MRVETPESTSLALGWTFRLLLLVVALAGYLGVAAQTADRLAVTTFGIPATIVSATKYQRMPATWTDLGKGPKAMFTVRVRPERGSEIITDLYLHKSVIEALVRGEVRGLTVEDGNPGRHLLNGDAPPPYGIGWGILGIAFTVLFVKSLRLK